MHKERKSFIINDRMADRINYRTYEYLSRFLLFFTVNILLDIFYSIQSYGVMYFICFLIKCTALK